MIKKDNTQKERTNNQPMRDSTCQSYLTWKHNTMHKFIIETVAHIHNTITLHHLHTIYPSIHSIAPTTIKKCNT